MRTAPPHISHGNIESDKKRGAKKSDRFKSNIKPFSFFCLDVDLLFLVPLQKCLKEENR